MIEILGILIGFCSIMLMFSILVTSIVQAISSVINLRAINLNEGLLNIANKVSPLFGKRELDSQLNERLRTLIAGNLGILLKRRVGYVSYEQVKNEIVDLYKDEFESGIKFRIRGDLEKKIKTHFERIENEMAERFQAWMNWLSIFVAFLVVGLFQINSFELLKKLSLDEDYRVALSAYYEKVDGPLLLIDSKEIFLNVNDRVNNEFILKYRAQEKSVEQLSAVGNENIDDALIDYSNVLENSPEFQQGHFSEYKLLLTRSLEEELKYQREKITGSMKELTEYDFEPLPNGKEYFYQSDGSLIKNWLGMIISAILISLGSPFWFSTVRNLIGLREMLSSSSTSNSTTQNNNTNGAQPKKTSTK